jgi:hypothetical protein
MRERPGDHPKPAAPAGNSTANPETAGLSNQTRGEVLAANPATRIRVVFDPDWKQKCVVVADDAAVDLAQVRRGVA